MTKEQLQGYRALKFERDKLLSTLQAIETVLYGPRSQNMDGMPRGGNGPKDDRRDALIDRKDKVQALYEAKVAELSEAILAIEQAIECLAPDERSLIRLRYIDGLKWERVCVEIGYERAQTHRIHAEALRKLAGKHDTQ